MAEPLVSVLMPCHNAARWIGDALDSVLRQTHRHLEVIVVDDGSRDDSAAVVERVAAVDTRVRLIRQANAGASAARNRAFAEARGELIAYLDADDLITPDKIAAQVAALRPAPTGRVASCAWQPFRCQPSDLPAIWAPIFHSLTPREYFLDVLNHRGYMPIGCWLIPRAVAAAAGPWNAALRGNDDGEYLSRIVARATAVAFVPGPLLHYRRVPGSLSAYKSPGDIEADMIACDLIGAVAERVCGVNLASETAIADSYNDLMIAGYPLSRPYLRELRERVARYGGARQEVILGGRAARALARAIGWKATRRLQRASWRYKAALRTS